MTESNIEAAVETATSEILSKRMPYSKPELKQHADWDITTGIASPSGEIAPN